MISPRVALQIVLVETNLKYRYSIPSPLDAQLISEKAWPAHSHNANPEPIVSLKFQVLHFIVKDSPGNLP